MTGRLLAASVLLLALASAGVLVAADGPGGAIPDLESDGATTTTAGGVDETADGTTATTASESAGETSTDARSGYALDIRSIETCGNTCRDVTAALTNEGSSARRNVTATTEVYADGDLLWSGNESVGTLSAGESHASMKRVQVGYAGGMKIRANDGYVTIVTVVRSDGGTTRFSDRRNVG